MGDGNIALPVLSFVSRMGGVHQVGARTDTSGAVWERALRSDQLLHDLEHLRGSGLSLFVILTLGLPFTGGVSVKADAMRSVIAGFSYQNF